MTIEQRLQRFETELWRWRILALCAVTGFVLLVLSPFWSATSSPKALAAEPTKILEKLQVESLEILNANGDVVGRFAANPIVAGTDEGEGAELSVLAPHSKASGKLRVRDNFVCFQAINSDENVLLSSDGMQLYKRDPKKVARGEQIKSKLKQGGQLSPSEINDLAASELSGSGELPAMTLGVSKLGGGVFVLANPLGKWVVDIESNKANSGVVIVADANGNPRKSLTSD